MATHIDAAGIASKAMQESLKGDAASYEAIEGTIGNTELKEEGEGNDELVIRWLTPKEARELAHKDGVTDPAEIEDYVASTGASLTKE